MKTYQLFKTNANDAITFAQMVMKDQYDKHHTPKFFKVEDQMKIRLHKDYTLPGIFNQKTSQQFVEPQTILERVEKLAYRLKIPPI